MTASAWSPIARFTATSSSASASARARAAAARAPGGKGASVAVMVSSAQRRFTAVGRVARSAAQAARNPSSEGSARIANQTPYAAATPMSGAPRTCMPAIARAASATVRNGRTTKSWGSAV